METLYQILNLIATSLLIPTIIILIFLFIKALFLIGSFFGNYTDRKKFKKNIQPLLKELEQNKFDKTLSFDNKRHTLSKYLTNIQKVGWTGVQAEKQLTDMRLEYKRQLESPKLLMKTGPMLGLMGTLIPMGPALAGLASGDIASMALNMQLAFATTVLGIFIGLTAFIILEIKKRWASEDYSEIEFLVDLKNSLDNA